MINLDPKNAGKTASPSLDDYMQQLLSSQQNTGSAAPQNTIATTTAPTFEDIARMQQMALRRKAMAGVGGNQNMPVNPPTAPMNTFQRYGVK